MTKVKKKSWQITKCIGVVVEEVEIFEVASLANKNNLYQFMHIYLYFFAPLGFNTFIKFRFAYASKPP